MPIFEYQCDSCNTRFEEIVLGNQPAPVCPECGKTKKFSRFYLDAVSGQTARWFLQCLVITQA